jgi:hypothetical membrane protein
MTSKKFVSLRTAGICGLLAPIIAFICIGLAILYSPWFSWTENYLSDLGGSPGDRPIWAAHGIASILFNFGLMIAGILGICLAIGIRKSGTLSSPLGNIGTLILIINSCALIGIGVFPESTGAPHTFFSFAFFLLVGLSLFFMGMGLIKSYEKKLGWFVIALLAFGLISIPLFLSPRPWGSNAIAEMIPIVSIALFSIVFGMKLLNLALEDQGHEKRNEEGKKIK